MKPDAIKHCNLKIMLIFLYPVRDLCSFHVISRAARARSCCVGSPDLKPSVALFNFVGLVGPQRDLTDLPNLDMRSIQVGGFQSGSPRRLHPVQGPLLGVGGYKFNCDPGAKPTSDAIMSSNTETADTSLSWSKTSMATDTATVTQLLALTTPFKQPRGCDSHWERTSILSTEGDTSTVPVLLSKAVPSCYPSGWEDVVPESRWNFNPAVCPSGWTYYDMAEDRAMGVSTASCCNRSAAMTRSLLGKVNMLTRISTLVVILV
jgi:hypothetical protein